MGQKRKGKKEKREEKERYGRVGLKIQKDVGLEGKEGNSLPHLAHPHKMLHPPHDDSVMDDVKPFCVYSCIKC